tara:strand:+ start:2815 stop:3000 length:186 start_codon:yes stop_codon:yes gene_type:complete
MKLEQKRAVGDATVGASILVNLNPIRVHHAFVQDQRVNIVHQYGGVVTAPMDLHTQDARHP